MIVLGSYAFGFGARATLLSVVTCWFDKEVRGRVYSAILLLEMVGMLSGEAILQNILSESFGLLWIWMGVAFLFCMISCDVLAYFDLDSCAWDCQGCYSIAFLPSFGIRLKLGEGYVDREISVDVR